MKLAPAEVYEVATFYHHFDVVKEGESPPPPLTVRVCESVTCDMFGARQLIERLRAQFGERVRIQPVSCVGRCDVAPLAIVGRNHIEQATLDRVLKAVDAGAVEPDFHPIWIGYDEYREKGGYTLLQECMAGRRSPEEIMQALEDSSLRGLGGAGFPAGRKWRIVGSQPAPRLMAVNVDEGEPGTFKDRECMLRRPHEVLEGLAITALTVGASQIYIYIRGEFLDERDALERALGEAKDPLAEFDFHIVLGHGAYICGEETALLESLEGKRGMPRLKPPYPTEQGFRNKPTLMHNVETLACVPSIVKRGGDWFRAKGRREAGSKLYCISGHVKVPGVYELALGVTLDELVEAAGGYVGTPKAFSPGGASSGFLPMSERELPLDYQSLAKAGSMLGSAGVVVLNDTVDLAEATRWQLEFFEEESCGQCAPCRIGTRYLHRQIERYLASGSPAALEHAADVGWEMEEGSICGLGMVAMKPLESAMQHFPEAFAKREPAAHNEDGS
jgi:NADH:ubiquinone oxidoreductase subunit F (NADH-binding)